MNHTLTAEQADLAAEAIRKCFLFDGLDAFRRINGDAETDLLTATLVALGETDDFQ